MQFSFPPAELPSELEHVRQGVRSFLEQERAAGRFSPATSGWMVFDREFSLRCGDRGLIGITWPERYGGRARSALERYVVIEELLAAGAPVGAHWVADRQSGPQILRHGSQDLRDALLPRMARGEVSFAIGMSEPDAGSDLAAIRSRAERSDGGWRLDGRKIWTTNGHRADYMIGLFRTDPALERERHRGMTQFVVELHSPGIERRPIQDLLGNEDFCEITFDGVFVPDSHVLGTPGEGWTLVTGELANERSGPERILSVFPLLSAAVDRLRGSRDRSAGRDIGRLVAHVATLREMSMSIAQRLVDGEAPALEAALVKDLGNALERETPEVLRRLDGLSPHCDLDETAIMLADAVMAAPSFTLRGGTPEILRGIIARGLGLR